MVDIDRSLESQLNKLQLRKVTSTDEVIGKGSYGRVIKVYVHRTLCAAKEIHPLLVENASSRELGAIRKSFYEECVKASRIHHPNVVQMLGIYYPTPQAKLPWLVMEMMETSLKSFLEKYAQAKVPLHFKLSILVDVAQGLEFLHGQDIIHRDLSSNNVLLTKHLIAKIADLGVAKVIQENRMKTHTQAPGTLHFMPPEALKNRPHYGKPVDVFSLACVTLHVMSHQWPEPKDLLCEDTMTAFTEMQRRDEYITFCVQPALKELVELCLHNKPEQRPEISDICVKLSQLKVTIENQVPFATDNKFELFDVVQQVSVQCQKLSAANKILTDNLACLKAVVQIQDQEKCLVIQENDHLQQIQEKDKQIQGKDQQIREKDQQLQEKDRQLQEKDQQIREKDQLLQEKGKLIQGQMQEKGRLVQEKDQQIQGKDRLVQEKDQRLQEKDQQMQKKDQQLQEKDKQVQGLMREKDRLVQEKDQQLREKDQQLREKDIQLQEKDKQIQEQIRDKERLVKEKDQQIREKDQQIQWKHQIQKKDNVMDQKTEELQNNVSTGVHQKEMVHPTIFLPPPGNEGTDTLDLVCFKADNSEFIKDTTQLGCYNPPTCNIIERPKNTSRDEAAVGHPHSDPPSNYAAEQSFNISNLPPPDLGDMSGEFGSVIPHIIPSSHIDDDNNQLIKDSTQLAYRNPPEAKLQVIHGNLKPAVDSTGYPPLTSDYRPHVQIWVPPIMSPSVSIISPSPNRDQKFDKTHPEVSSASALGQGQYANVPSGSEVQHQNTQPPNTLAHSGDTAMAGGPQSLPSGGNSDGSEFSTKFGSLSHHKYNRQKSIPTDASLSGEITASTTGTTTNKQLPVSDHIPIVAAVPLTDQPTPEASKFGKTNLHVLKNRLQHRKEITETMFQSGTVGSRTQPSDDYVNVKAYPQLLQGVSDNTNKPTFGRSDVTRLRNKLVKTKEEIEKTVGAANRIGGYSNLSDISTYISENPVMLNNPHDRKPVAAPRSTTSANFAGSHTHSASSTSSSIKAFKLWQCAYCQVINEAHCNSCVTCKLPQGKMANISYFCEFCQLRMYVPLRKESEDACCPRCKKVFESAC